MLMLLPLLRSLLEHCSFCQLSRFEAAGLNHGSTHILIPTTFTYIYQYIFTHTLTVSDTYSNMFPQLHTPTRMHILSCTHPYTLILRHTHHTLPYTLTYLYIYSLTYPSILTTLPHSYTHTHILSCP